MTMEPSNTQDTRAAQEALARLAIKNLRFKRRTVPPPPTQPDDAIEGNRFVNDSYPERALLTQATAPPCNVAPSRPRPCNPPTT